MDLCLLYFFIYGPLEVVEVFLVLGMLPFFGLILDWLYFFQEKLVINFFLKPIYYETKICDYKTTNIVVVFKKNKY